MQPGGPVLIVKHHGHGHHARIEEFDREKLHKSIVAACLSCGVPTGHAESIARHITDEVVDWLSDKPEVTSEDLRITATHYLKTHHPDAAYLYEHHRSTL
ncbi:MAG: ATP cone domain-containing protein [Candidatus Microsaccharimonas sp.]